MRQRIALFGNFGTGNLGNEATLQAMVYNLRKYLPNAEISCICPGPESTASQYNISAVPIRAPFPIRRVFSGSNSDSGGVKRKHLWSYNGATSGDSGLCQVEGVATILRLSIC